MRLKKVKLAGFKSFVEPTIIDFQVNLAAIVGPNGCGKSNIIDAIRWVMGESSAKQLRGESMCDVIFNGSLHRKPVGQAAIELFFDNSDVSLGGEYAKYAEIAIRREVGRDGMSNYYLNGTRCRRRDIVDIFLGTGLGADSYAIIGQGTISQFIEAKPDDLRTYLEEAAGISRYKERRHETENRMKHTRENLARLNDIREEIDKTLKHLKSQANAAERFKKYKQNERLTKAQLHALHCQNLTQKLQETVQNILLQEKEFETKTAGLLGIEAKIEQFREEHIQFTGVYNTVQENFYRIGANIAKLEQQIQHNKNRYAELSQELAKTQKAFQETSQHQATDEGQIEMLESELSKLESANNETLDLFKQAEQKLQNAESNMHDWQNTWDDFNVTLSQINQRAEVEQMRAEHLQQAVNNESVRIEKLKNELLDCNFADLANEIEILQVKQDEIKKHNETMHDDLEIMQEKINKQREQSTLVTSELSQVRNNLQTLVGRQASLEALQQAALGQNKSGLVTWLKNNQLDDKPRLVQGLKVAAGWEIAVETVLGSYLEALCIHGLESISVLFEKIPQENLVFFDVTNNRALPNAEDKKSQQMSLLVDKIDADWSLLNLLHGVYVAENLNEAIALRTTLALNESIITKDGIWLGNSWLRVTSNANQKSGVLSREKELREINKNIKIQREKIVELEQALKNEQQSIITLEQEYHTKQQSLRDISKVYGEISGQIHAKQNNFAYLKQRQNTLKQELANHEQNFTKAKEQLQATNLAFEEAVSKKEIYVLQRETLLQKRDELQLALDEARKFTQQNQEAKNAAKLRAELLCKQLEYLQQSLERNRKRLNDIKEQENRLQTALEAVMTPETNLEQELEQELTKHVQVGNNLKDAKQNLGNVEHTLREQEKNRLVLSDNVAHIREILENLKMERQELQLRSANHEQQIVELGYELTKVLEELLSIQNDADDANDNLDQPSAVTVTNMAEIISIQFLEEKLVKLANKIERLGPINLAAIEEFEAQQKRKEYLDTQNNDLITALETLEGAIKKIDQETKERFREVFNNVNDKFSNLFPKMFNGGKAYLEMVGDDVLTSGVSIMAQPPGKRNSNIHLLSGGEKALTAIALIFSIFQLNPAPFCMLDEVDAPLDDANVQRFCNLVKEMSQTIQLIFISHNKQTLEMADQLTGVTMQEPGVSRIVSVDLQKAVSMVEEQK